MEAKMHMKEWLIAQIDSGKYDGLRWEDERKSMFRIPWKHAAKKDYKEEEDAALFKVGPHAKFCLEFITRRKLVQKRRLTSVKAVG